MKDAKIIRRREVRRQYYSKNVANNRAIHKQQNNKKNRKEREGTPEKRKEDMGRTAREVEKMFM